MVVVLRVGIRNRHTRRNDKGDGTQFTCFTGTTVQRLTQNALLGMEHEVRDEGTEFTCFNGTKVQILTQKLEAQAGLGEQVALGWAKLALVATLNPKENLDMAFKVRAERVHVDALAKAERALYDAGIQPLNVSDYGQTRAGGKETDNLDGGGGERPSEAKVKMWCKYL